MGVLAATITIVAGLVTVVMAGYFLNFKMSSNAAHADDERRAAEDAAKNADAKSAVLERNIAATESQVGSLKTQNDMLTAQLRAAQGSVDDLIHSIETSQPSALPTALRAQLDRLRAHVQLPTTPDVADPNPGGGEANPVHEAAATDKPA